MAVTPCRASLYSSTPGRIRTGDLCLRRAPTTNREQQKPAYLLGFRISFSHYRPPETVGFVTESVTGVSLPPLPSLGRRREGLGRRT